MVGTVRMRTVVETQPPGVRRRVQIQALFFQTASLRYLVTLLDPDRRPQVALLDFGLATGRSEEPRTRRDRAVTPRVRPARHTHGFGHLKAGGFADLGVLRAHRRMGSREGIIKRFPAARARTI